MMPYTFCLTVLATTCVAFATWLAWYWLVPFVEKIGHRQVENRLRRLSQIGFEENQIRFGLLLVETAVIATIVVLASTTVGWFIGVALLVIALHLRSIVLEWFVTSRESLLRKQVTQLAAELRNLARSGLALPDALADVSQRMPLPLNKFTRRIVMDHRRGRPLREAVLHVRSSLQLDAYSLLVTAIDNSMNRGSSLVHSLAGVSETLENAIQAEQQLEAKTSSSRATVLILSLMPIGFIALFRLMSPESFPLLFTTSSGQIMLCAVIVLTYAGSSWARKISHPEL